MAPLRLGERFLGCKYFVGLWGILLLATVGVKISKIRSIAVILIQIISQGQKKIQLFRKKTKNKYPSPEVLERIASAPGIDTIGLFSTDRKLPEALKNYRKAVLKGIKAVFGQIIDEKLKDLGKKP